MRIVSFHSIFCVRVQLYICMCVSSMFSVFFFVMWSSKMGLDTIQRYRNFLSFVFSTLLFASLLSIFIYYLFFFSSVIFFFSLLYLHFKLNIQNYYLFFFLFLFLLSNLIFLSKIFKVFLVSILHCQQLLLLLLLLLLLYTLISIYIGVCCCCFLGRAGSAHQGFFKGTQNFAFVCVFFFFLTFHTKKNFFHGKNFSLFS